MGLVRVSGSGYTVRMNGSNQQPGVPGAAAREVQYPAVFHFRVIADAPVPVTGALAELLGGYEVVGPLSEANLSSGGRYRSYGVSVRMASREQLQAFDGAVRALAGVRMLL